MKTSTLFLTAAVVSGCGLGNVGSQGVALTFHNDRDGKLKQGLNDRSPSSFGMKLIAAYLAEDVDPVTQNNVGATEMIYLNPACGDDIGHCELSPGTAFDGTTFTRFVNDYFDFNASSDAVNAAIGSQRRAIPPGTYRYTRLEFCKGNEGHAPNVRWAADGLTPREFFSGGCGVTSAPLSVPLAVATGQAIDVMLSYDLSRAVSDMGPGGQVTGMDCDGTSCLVMPTFIPSSTVQ